MKKIKVISLFVIMAMLVSYCPVFAAETEADVKDEDRAYVIFDEKVKTHNINQVVYNYKNVPPIIEKVDGKYALKRIKKNEPHLFLNIGLDDNFAFSENAIPVNITVEYYDLGTGSFSMQYNMDEKENRKDCEIVTLTNTRTWMKHTFQIDDFKSCNVDLLGTDFRLALWTPKMAYSSTDVYFRSVEITKPYYKEPIMVKANTAYKGRIFGGDEDKIIDLVFTNITEDLIESDIEYNIKDSNNSVIDSGVFTNTFKSGDEFEHSMNLNDKVKKFGVYTLNVTVKNRVVIDGIETDIEFDKTFRFSVVNKSNPDERNRKMYINTATGINDPADVIETAGYAGFGGLRNDVGWRDSEKTKGVYTIPEKVDQLINGASENNMDFLAIILQANPLYGRPVVVSGTTKYSVPHNEESYNAIANFTKYVANKYKEKVDAYEIWNEYNIQWFNPTLEDSVNYYNFLKPCYQAIKSENPNAIVIGNTNATSNPSMLADYDPQFAAGTLDYIDALGYHNYTDFRNRNALIDNTSLVISKMEAYNKVKPIWMTEVGLSTYDSSSLGMIPWTDEQRSQMCVKSYAVGLSENYVDKFAIYCLIETGEVETQNEDMYGILKYSPDPDNSLTAKGTYVTLAALNKLLWDKKINTYFNEENGVWAYDFVGSSNEHVATVWSEGDDEFLAVDLGTKEIEVLDMYSNSLGTLKSDDGKFNISVDDSPIYIRGNFTKFEKCDNSISMDSSLLEGVESDMVSFNIYDKENRNLRIEADLPDCLELAENNGFKDGKATVKISIKANSIGSYEFPIRLYDGDNLCFASKMNVNVIKPISISHKMKQVSVNDDKNWQVVITVNNLTSTSTFSGDVKLTAIDGEDYTSNNARFSYLPPNESVDLYLNIEYLKKCKKKITAVVNLNTGYSESYSTEIDFSNAKMGEAEIDGIISPGEWNGVWFSAYRDKDIKRFEDWKGPDDASFDASLQYDKDNLYIGVIVKDNIHYNEEEPSNVWNGDSIQFAIEDGLKMGDAVQYGKMEQNFTELGIALAKGKPVAYRFKAQTDKCPIGVIENIKIDVKRIDGKTVYELSVPWKELFGETYVLDDSRVLGFSMLVNDNDSGERRGFVEYNSGIGIEKNAYQFGELIFVK